jgi:glycosyltransferase involved in cell wall biosynthesis
LIFFTPLGVGVNEENQVMFLIIVMNILFVSSGNTLNGISPVVESQGNSLIEYGHQVDFFTIKGKGLKGYINATIRLRKFLRGKTYNLIHAHYGLSGIISLMANRGLPLVVSFMGDDLLGSNHKKGGISKISLFLIGVNRFLALRYYRISIVKSAQMLRILNVRNAEVIPNGVNLKHFYPVEKAKIRNELNLNLTDIIIVFVSTPARPEKNYSLAQEAVAALKGDNIRLIPVFNMNHNEICKWLNASDVVLLTSFHEGSPNIIKEAMACNCPIVSTDVGDVKFIFGSTEGCFLGGFDTNELTEIINKAIQFSKSENKTKGRQRIIDIKTDSESIAERITLAYKKAIDIN